MPKNTPARIIDQGRGNAGSLFVGGAGGGSGALPWHNSLPGLTVGDPHGQYLTPARGNALYVPLARQIIAGAGLQGTGSLTNNVTLAVAAALAGAGLTLNAGVLAVGVAGLGLSVGADAVTLTSSSNPGAAASILATDAAGAVAVQTLTVGTNSAAAAGNLLFPGHAVLSAARSAYVILDNDNNATSSFLAILSNSTDPATATELFRFTETGRLGIGDASPSYPLDVTGDAQITGALHVPTIDTLSGNLTIQPVGDLILNPGGQDVLPGGNIEDDLGDYNRKWRTFFAAELYVETLVAQDVLSTIGGRIEVTPTTTLIADLAAVATTMDVKHNSLRSGEFAYLMAAPGGVAQIEVLKISSAATAVTGGWRYTIVRNQDGTGANGWVAGDAVASLAKNVGEGHISLTATSTIYNHLGPTLTIYTRTGTTTWNQVAPVVAQGNLESFVDYSTPIFGAALGNDLTKTPATGFKGLTADATNGLRMFSTAISTYNGATQTFYLAPTGLDMWLGPSAADKRLTWDGSTLGIVGNVKATAGYIGGTTSGWAITSGKLASTNIALYSGDLTTTRIELGNGTAAYTAGIKAVGDAAHTAFWAGSAADNTLNAKFRVTAGGSLTSTDATFGTLKVDSGGVYIAPISTFNVDYGYKFKYGTAVGAGLIGAYSAGNDAWLWLLNNTDAGATIIDSSANSLLTVRGTAGSTKSSTIDIRAERLVSGVAKFTGLSLLNTPSARKATLHADTLVVAPEAGGEYAVWHAGNDGSASGLDADTLDGQHAIAFAALSSGNTFSAANTFNNTVVFASAVTVNDSIVFEKLSTPPAFISGKAVLFLLDVGNGNYQFRVKIRTTDGTKTADKELAFT